MFLKKMKTTFLLAFFILATGCAHKNPLTEFQFQTVMAPPYVLASWYRISEPGSPIRIYIEGDGHSFDAYNRPTANPTPTSTFLREIAANDPNPNVAYLGRPCQYLQTNTCTQDDWTCGRFSPQIVNSMEQSVLQLSKKGQTKDIVLIGYSGGAQIAGLVAVRHPQKINRIITIAGVLDQQAWTSYHNDSPLDKSLNLKNYEEIFNQIPQTHFIGKKDRVVPNHLTESFVKDKSTIITLEKADHQKGYDSALNQLYQLN